MIYVVYFSSLRAPKTGLSPSIITYKKVSDGTDVASPPTVSEIGGGLYKFTATPTEALVAVVDGGSTLTNAERYKVMQITPNDGSLDAAVSTRASESGGNVAAIKAKTDNLPADPASNTQVNTRLAAASYITPDNPGISAIKAKTDNLPGSPASETTLAAVKAKTDLIPANPAIEGNVQGHVTDALAAYDPPIRAEASGDKEAILAAIAGLNDITVGELLAGDLSDNLSLPANSLADLIRKLFWVLCNRLVITDISGAFTAYKSDGVTPAARGSNTDNGVTTERSEPTWL